MLKNATSTKNDFPLNLLNKMSNRRSQGMKETIKYRFEMNLKNSESQIDSESNIDD